MLILARRKGETLRLNCQNMEIRIVVTYIGSGQVKLGVEAPVTVEVIRDELTRREAPPEG